MREQRTFTDFDEGFRITRSPGRVRIEATDYHTRPLELGREDLAKLGLMLLEDLGTVSVEGASKASPSLAQRLLKRPKCDVDA